MKRVNGIAVSVVAAVLALSAVPVYAARQQNPTPQATAGDAATPHTWPLDQLLPLSMREAWHLSGKNEQVFFEMVKQLAELSAQKRSITPPDDKLAGEKAGEWIKKQAKKDPDQLLYVVVDRAVQYSARPAEAK